MVVFIVVHTNEQNVWEGNMELKELIKYARDNRCSDLHITAGEAVAVRKYGELELLDITPSIEETEDMIFSILGDEDIQNVQAGKDIDVASTDESGGRLRINIYHQRRNLAASIRLLDSVIPSFEELGHSGKLFSKLVEKRSGLILVTGPTGSGKSTTLAAMIDYINNNMSRHIITVEDPIEYVYGFKKSMIHQRQVGRDVPDFATALRSALREDPDVILVGEMRDYETINAAKALASEVITEKMFEPIGKDTFEAACRKIDESDYVIDTGCPVGQMNAMLKDVLEYAAEKKKIILKKPDIDTLKSLFTGE